MAKGKGKRVRAKGKISLSKYFKKLDDGDRVALVEDAGINTSFPDRFKGKSGKVIGSQGSFKIIELNDGNKVKKIIAHPVHLKKV